MALTALLKAVRALNLKQNTRIGAIELAFRARGGGEVEISYERLRRACNCSIRTAFRIIERLLEREIITRERTPIGPKRYALNRYRFLLEWKTYTPARLWPSAKKATSAIFLAQNGKTAEIFPDKKREDLSTVREELQKAEKGLRNFPPPTPEGRQACAEAIARLRALLDASIGAAVPGPDPEQAP